MKSWSILLLLAAVASTQAQSNQPPATVASTNSVWISTNWPAMALGSETNSQAAASPLSDEAFAARIIRNARETPMISNELKPNEINIGKFTYSGIAIEIVKMPNPLQLVNPFAPPEYGDGEINLVRDPAGHPSGWKFFSIQF
jgi:hypothetical protein